MERRRKRRLKQIRNISIISAAALLLVVGAVFAVWGLSGGTQDKALAPEGQVLLNATQEPVALDTPAPTVTLKPATPAPTQTPQITPQPTARKATIRIIGDIIAHDDQLKAAKQSDGTYNFEEAFSLIAPSLKCADYTIANLETTIELVGEKPYSGYPRFNTPEGMLDAMKKAGIDCLTLANNHILDRMWDGLKQTVNYVEKYGFDHVGGYRTQEERNTPVIVEVNGIKIGLVAYTAIFNGAADYCHPDALKYGVLDMKKSTIQKDVKALKEAGAEYIIALPHWGEEYSFKAISNQKSYAKIFIAAGCDAVIGSHAHVVQPVEWVTTKDESGNSKKGLVAYSLGNALGNFTNVNSESGMIIEFTVNELEDGGFETVDVGYVPIYIWRDENGQNKPLPIGKYYDNPPEGMTNEFISRMKKGSKIVRGVIDETVVTVLYE